MILLLSVSAMLVATASPRRPIRGPVGRGPPDLLGVARTPAVGAGVVGRAGRVRDLVVRRADGVELVHGVSFDIGRGEILGVVGSPAAASRSRRWRWPACC